MTLLLLPPPSESPSSPADRRPARRDLSSIPGRMRCGPRCCRRWPRPRRRAWNSGPGCLPSTPGLQTGLELARRAMPGHTSQVYDSCLRSLQGTRSGDPRRRCGRLPPTYLSLTVLLAEAVRGPRVVWTQLSKWYLPAGLVSTAFSHGAWGLGRDPGQVQHVQPPWALGILTCISLLSCTQTLPRCGTRQQRGHKWALHSWGSVRSR